MYFLFRQASFLYSNFSEEKRAVFIDLCSGAGGLSLGFQRAGFRIAVAVECKPSVAETYQNNFPCTEVIQEKIENVTGERLLDKVSQRPFGKLVLAGGTPCQPFSQANHQNKGKDHPSASTVDHFVRLVEEVRPEGFLFENVANFQLINKGKSMRQFLNKLKKLSYNVSFAILKSEDFGVPQLRKRLFVGGIKSNSWRDFDINIVKRRKVRPTVGDAISDLPFLQDGGGGADAMNYPNQKKLTSYQRRTRKGSQVLYNHWSSKNSPEVVRTISYIGPGQSLKKSWNHLPQDVRNRYKNSDNIHYNIYKRLIWNGLSPTIVHPRRAMLLHPYQNRIITVREAARLQDFPDKFRFSGGIDSQYQQVANAVPPSVAESLAHLYTIYLADGKYQKVGLPVKEITLSCDCAPTVFNR
jgi:DNA (cytosine-5)-methyltransferase 1